ncbi:MAG: efflux transporter outer membrane subunit [Sedimentisphaerales bacterium]|nr:efflux transporter outer membrane subunit [Sedimentisphaerales bacterium]
MTFYKSIFIKYIPYIIALYMIVLISGCSPVGPDYEPPKTQVPQNWHAPLESGITAEQFDPNTLTKWWTMIDDPMLTDIIERAIANNLDLKIAIERIRESRARRAITEASLYPSFNSSGSATKSRSRNVSNTTSHYSANFDAGWEMDFFGGLRRSVEAANADLQASQENMYNTLVSLLSEVALNYVEIRTYQARINSVQSSIDLQNETYQLTLWRNEAQLIDELTVQQALYNLESSRSQIPSLRAGLEQSMNSLALLLGEEAGKLQEELQKVEPIPNAPENIAIGVPADVIRRRPDIRSAELSLAAQTARVGVATAQLYPSFTLNGSLGLDATSLSNISSGTWTLSGGPRFSWPVFDAGAIKQNINVQSALVDESLLQYKSVVLSAFKEVEDGLISYVQEQQRRNNLRAAAQAAQSAVQLATQKFEVGLTDFTTVLDTQRSLLSFQDQLAQSDGMVTSNVIRLYKALGGGWESFASNEY